MAFIMSSFNCGHQLVTSASVAIPSLPKQYYSCGHKEKVRNVRRSLVKLASSGNAFKELIMIDQIQRLGIDHLFSDEIRDAMERQYVEWYSDSCNAWCRTTQEQDTLHEVALRFRNRLGKFEEGFSNNIQGLMSLFEASQMSIQGEEILDEANAFTTQLLLENLDDNKHNAAINTVLRLPYHKSLSKFTAMELLQCTDHKSESEGCLFELAKLDFDMAAISYRHEFLHFSRWWKEIGLAEELELARDQSVKWYTWAVAAQPHPNFWEERLDITKPIALLYVVDDLFDVYGDLHHLSLFTQAINRWDLAAVEELPEHMRSTWRAIFDTTSYISHKIWMKHGWNPITYLHKAWADFCNACVTEAQWNASGYLPTTSEYLNLGIITSGVPMILSHGFFLLAETLNTDTLQLLNDDPKIISSVATILRLSDDLGTAQDEGQDGYDGSYVKCYMNENDGVSMDTARGKVHGMISDAWKVLNKECLHMQPHPFSSTHNFGRACLNSARMVPLMYGYEHGHLPGLDKFFMLLLNGS
ncbi:hypothetical protein V2J09_019288 [Rumex salicifolius]